MQIDMIAKNMMSSGEKLVIVGDFNYPNINWLNDDSNDPPHHPSSVFLDTIQSNYLTQFIDKPTHFRALQNPTLIDLILSNDQDYVNDLEYYPPFGKSHHCTVCFNINISHVDEIKPSVSKFSINKGKYEEMRQHFKDIDWEASLKGDVNTIFG